MRFLVFDFALYDAGLRSMSGRGLLSSVWLRATTQVTYPPTLLLDLSPYAPPRPIPLRPS
eukprot:2388786-Rhodomonas_salina.2